MAEENGKPAAPVTKVPDTVTVGLKLPNGLVLHIDTMEEYNEQVMGGGVKIAKRARRLQDTYTLNGNSMDPARIASGDVQHLIIGGFGITSGIPKDYWDRWFDSNKDSALVRNGLIWAQPNDASARSRAIEGADVRSGMEPIDPAAPGRFASDVRGIQVGTRTAA